MDDSGDHGRFGEVDLRDVLVEVRLGGGFHPVGTVAEVHGVQVLQEDEILAVLVLQSGGVPDLLELSTRRALGVLDDGQLHVLLGDGRSALTDAARFEVGPCCSNDGLEVHAVVHVKPLVFDGDHGVTHQQGDFEQGSGTSSVLWRNEGGDRPTVAGHHHRRLGLLGDRDLELACLVAVTRGGHGSERQDDTQQAESGRSRHCSSLARPVTHLASAEWLEAPYWRP